MQEQSYQLLTFYGLDAVCYLKTIVVCGRAKPTANEILGPEDGKASRRTSKTPPNVRRKPRASTLRPKLPDTFWNGVALQQCDFEQLTAAYNTQPTPG